MGIPGETTPDEAIRKEFADAAAQDEQISPTLGIPESKAIPAQEPYVGKPGPYTDMSPEEVQAIVNKAKELTTNTASGVELKEGSAAEYVEDSNDIPLPQKQTNPNISQDTGIDPLLASELPIREPLRTPGDQGQSHDITPINDSTSTIKESVPSQQVEEKADAGTQPKVDPESAIPLQELEKDKQGPISEAIKQAEDKGASAEEATTLESLNDALKKILELATANETKLKEHNDSTNSTGQKIIGLIQQLEDVTKKTSSTVNNFYTNNYNNQGPVVGDNVKIGDTNYGTQNIADHGSQINNIDTLGDVNIGNTIVDAAIAQAQVVSTAIPGVSTVQQIDVDYINMLLENAERMNTLADDPFMPEDLGDAAHDAASDTVKLTRVSQPASDQPAANPDPNATATKPAAAKQVVDPNAKPVTDQPAQAGTPVQATASTETQQAEPGGEKDDSQKAAEKLVGPLTDSEQKEFKDAGKTDEGFLFSIKRMFSGQNWKRWIPGVAMSVAGSFGLKAAAGLAVATGPIGMGIFGGALIGFGLWGAFKTVREVAEVAKKEGKSWKEILGNREAVLGILAGGAISGVSKVATLLVPGLGGPIVGILAESATRFAMDKYLNNKQKELVGKYMDTYAARRYAVLKDAGYVIRGENGAPGVNLEAILADMNNPKLSEGERKTAKKAAIAAIKFLQAQTGDTTTKTLKYTVKENGKDVVKEIDLSKIAYGETEGSTAKYLTLDLASTDKVSVEAFIDTLDVNSLATATRELWNKTDATKREALAKNIVEIFVGIEGADVDTVLSEERKSYFNTVHFTTGMHAAMGAVNAITAVVGGVNLMSDAFNAPAAATGGASGSSAEQNRQATDEYRAANNDPDATVARMQTQNGHTVDVVDLDGNGSSPDLIIDKTDGQTMILSQAGAERAFELANPTLGDVSTTDLHNTTGHGILGTYVDGTGKVVGMAFGDADGNIGVMKADDLTSHFSVTNASGAAQTFTLGNIQANGNAVLTVNGVDHNINIAKLDAITIAGSAGEIVGGPAITVESGDSINSLLHDVMRQVKIDNPGLAGYDDYQLERMMYQDGLSTSDSAIRTETGMGNPVQTTELSGKAFDWTKSPTIMGWLTELNNGQQLNIAAGTPSAGTPSGVLNLGFAGDAASIDSPIVEVQETSNPFTPAGWTGMISLVGAAVLAAMHRDTIGGINRENQIDRMKSTSSTGSSSSGKPGDDDDDKKKGLERSAEVGQASAESKEVRVSRLKELMEKQILKNVTKDGDIIIARKRYMRVAGQDDMWLATAPGSTPVSTSELADLFINQPEEAQKKVNLILALDTNLVPEVQITLESEDGSKTSYKKSATNVNADGLTVVEWVNVDKVDDKKDSAQLADLILELKDKVTKVATTSTTAGGDGSSPAPSAEASAAAVEAEAKIENKSFSQVAQDILKALHTNSEPYVAADGVVYQYNASSKVWERNDEVGKLSFFQKLQLNAFGAPKNEGPDFLSDAQIIERWNKSKSLEDDLQVSLSLITPDAKNKRVNVDEAYSRVSVGKESKPRVQIAGQEIYTWNEADKVYVRTSGKNGAEKLTEDQLNDMRSTTEVKDLPLQSKGIVWKSKSNSFSDIDFAKKIAALRTTSENAAPAGSPEAKGDTKTEAATNNTPEKEQKGKKSRWLLKTALVVAGVAAGIAAHASGFAVAAAVGAGAALLGMGASQKILEGYAARRKDLQAELTAKAQSEKRAFTLEEEEKLKEYERKREAANRWIEGIKVIRFGVMSFGITSTVLGYLNPVLDIDIKSIDVTASWKALVDKITLQRTPMGASSPETNLHYGQ